MGKTQTDAVLRLIRNRGILRPRDLAEHGIAREQLVRLMKRGVVDRPSRGVYVLANNEPTEHRSLAEVCSRVRHGVVCLLSALRFHKMTTQNPHEIWLAIDRKARMPKLDYPPIRIVRFAPDDMSEGVSEHKVDSVTIRVTNPARTVVDCFVYRNKIGLDVALEALRDCWRTKKATMREFHAMAQQRRMASVMRPYLESLV